MSASAFITVGDRRVLVNAERVSLQRVESADVSAVNVDCAEEPFTTVQVVNSGWRRGEAILFVYGSPAERAATLRRFAATFADAAAELEASEEVAS